MVFNGQSANLLISSLKSMIGHTMGASGAIQFGLTAMIIFYRKTSSRQSIISVQTRNAVSIMFPNQVISRPGLKAALVNSFGFKGHHYVLSLIQGSENDDTVIMKLQSSFSNNHNPAAFLIPGIGLSYADLIASLSNNLVFQKRCAIAGIMPLLRDSGPTLEDTLDVQKASYAANCTLCDLYKAKGIYPDITIGYSMGIYAALYAGGYYSFETGLEIVEKAFLLTREICDSLNEEYTMAVIMGLTEQDIQEIVFKSHDACGEIAVYNGKHHFVIAGEKNVIENGIERALYEGAFEEPCKYLPGIHIILRYYLEFPMIFYVISTHNAILSPLPKHFHRSMAR